MGCSPSHEGFYGDTALNNVLNESKREDPKLKSLNSVTFEEHDLVWSAGKDHQLKPSKFSQINEAIKSFAATPTKFMQQQVTQEQQRRDSFKGGLNPQKSVLGWSGAGVSDTEEGSGPEIIDLEETLMIRTHSTNLKSTECQTDPVKDEVFDWDLSDKTDCETQTVPPTRANSTLGGGIIYSYTANFDLQFQDAIVQTDQRLAFLLRRSSTRLGHKLSGSGIDGQDSLDDDNRSRSNEGVLSSLSQGLPKLTDAWVQTYVEVQEVGIQVGPEDFCSRCNDFSVECNHNNSAMRPRHSHEHNHHYPRYQRTNLDEEDDGYNGSSDNADDDCDEDVKTLHISATSTRLERRKHANTANRHSNKSKKPQSRYRELVASSSDRTGGESSDPTDGIITFVTDSEDDRAFSSPSPAPTQSDAGFQVDIPRGVTQKFSTSNKHIIHAQIEERNERKDSGGKNMTVSERNSVPKLPPVPAQRTNRGIAGKVERGRVHDHIPSAGTILAHIKIDVGVQTEESDTMTNDHAVSSHDMFDNHNAMHGRHKREIRDEDDKSPLRKYELIGKDPTLFHLVDQWVLTVSKKRYKSLKHIVRLLVDQIEDEESYAPMTDLIKVRAFFRWCTENIRYNPHCSHREMTTKDILKEKVGVCRQYVKIFSEMCMIADLSVKNIRGFSKAYTYLPGREYTGAAEGDPPHAWNAVNVAGSWRLLDCTFGAGKTNPDGLEFQKQLNEHFFLTDPDEFIFTHFPSDETEENYDRWQLLKEPVSLENFLVQPLLTGLFFDYALRLEPELTHPIIVHEKKTTINIWAWEPVRYRYKFFPANKDESDSCNCNVLNFLKGKSRKLSHFIISPPDVGQYYLKVYAKPEGEILSENDTLDHVATFLIHTIQIKDKPLPYPKADQPWGVTKAFFDTDARIPVSQMSVPIIHMIGKNKKRVVLKTPRYRILSVAHLYDCEGNEVVQDKDRDVYYTVLLSKKNPIAANRGDEPDESTLVPFIKKSDTPTETTFIFENPPKVGFYKLQIFGVKKPKKPGKLKIPLIANFLIDFRHTAGTEDVNDIVMSAAAELMSRSNIPSAASGAAALNAASKFSRSLSLQREYAASSAKRLRQKVSKSLNNSANSTLGKLMSDSPSKGIDSKKSDSSETGEITVHTPLLSRIETPIVESPEENPYKANIREVGPRMRNHGKQQEKSGVDNSAFRSSIISQEERERYQNVEQRVSSAATSTANTNEASSSCSDLKVIKEKLSNSIGSRSRLSSVDVS